MDTQLGKSTVGEMLPLFIIIVVLLLFLVFCIRMIISTSKAKKQGKQAHNELQQLSSKKQAVAYGKFKHTAGLPLAENTFCELFYCPDHVEISGNGTQFNLTLDKITDISLTSSVDIHKHYVSSAAGAVGGALLFGPIGALIGGRVKEKKIRDVRTYLIFTYAKDGAPDYIAFDVSGSLQSKKFVEEFKKRPQIFQSIDL